MFELPELKYSYDALEPYIDRETMELHHLKHHATYISNLNNALKNFEASPGFTLENLLKNLKQDVTSEVYWDIRNNGGGHMNHTLFFNMMSPKASREPRGELLEKINSTFGSFEAFKAKFRHSALSRFGSGWAWLLMDEEGRIFIKSTANQDCPITDGKKIILGLDVWEHAYYLNYRNRRAEYIDKWWNVVDWDFAGELYAKAKH